MVKHIDQFFKFLQMHYCADALKFEKVCIWAKGIEFIKTLDYCPAVENLQLGGATCCVCYSEVANTALSIANTACSPAQLQVLYCGAVSRIIELCLFLISMQ